MYYLFVARGGPSEVPLLLGFAVGFAPALAYFCHMSLFVALRACDVLAFYLTHVLFVCASTPIADDVGV